MLVPCEEIVKQDLPIFRSLLAKELIKKYSCVYKESNDKMIIQLHFGMSLKWDVYIITNEDSYEILMENTEKPLTRFGEYAQSIGRKVLTKIEKKLQ